jgi:hypothetical protein
MGGGAKSGAADVSGNAWRHNLTYNKLQALGPLQGSGKNPASWAFRISSSSLEGDE